MGPSKALPPDSRRVRGRPRISRGLQSLGAGSRGLRAIAGGACSLAGSRRAIASSTTSGGSISTVPWGQARRAGDPQTPARGSRAGTPAQCLRLELAIGRDDRDARHGEEPRRGGDPGKNQLLVDTERLVLEVRAHGAKVPDQDGTRLLESAPAHQHPRGNTAFPTGRPTGEDCLREGNDLFRIDAQGSHRDTLTNTRARDYNPDQQPRPISAPEASHRHFGDSGGGDQASPTCGFCSSVPDYRVTYSPITGRDLDHCGGSRCCGGRTLPSFPRRIRPGRHRRLYGRTCCRRR